MDAPAAHPEISAGTDAKVRRPRSRAWRWIRRIILFLIGLVVAIAVILQIVLWTDIPRKLIVEKLQTTLGLRVSAKEIHIGWSGQTTLDHVEISLPLAQQSFLEVPQLDVTHTSLPMIMLTQDVELTEAVFHHPTLLVSQDQAGDWNVSEAIDLITRAAGKNQAQSEPNKAMPLPAVIVEDGTLQLTDRNGKTATIQALEENGAPSGPLAWKYDVRAQNRLKLTGQVSPGGVWEHEIAFEVGDISQWLSPWLSNAGAFRAAGHWHGDVEGTTVAGRVTFEQLAVGTLNAQGAANVQRTGDGKVTISPSVLILQAGDGPVQRVSANSGAIVLDATSASAKDLVLAANGGETKLNGSYNWGDQSTTLRASWRDIALPQGITHRGDASVKIAMPWPGAPRIDADVHSAGTTSAGAWDGNLVLSGAGRSWNDIDWNATLASASWSGQGAGSVTNIKAIVLTRPDKITLQSISGAVRGASLNGSGEYDLDSHAWQVAIDGGNVAVPNAQIAPAAFKLRASGNESLAKLDDLVVTSGDIEVRGHGSYDYRLPKPVTVQLVLSHFPTLEGVDPNAFVRGKVYGKASLSGTSAPLDLTVDAGQLYGTGVAIGNRTIGDLAVQLTGEITSSQARFATTEATILGGKWRVSGDWPQSDDGAQLLVDVRDLPLAEVGGFFQNRDVSGSLKGEWTIDIPSLDRTRITAHGDAELRDVLAGKFQADRITAHTVLDDAKLSLDPITLAYKDGTADAHVYLPVHQPTQVKLTANVRNWPATAPSENASATVSAQTDLAMDLKNKSAVGPFNAQIAFNVQDRDAGSLSIATQFAGRTINLNEIRAQALGGAAQGNGVLPLDQPEKSTANLTVQAIDAAELAAFIPNADGLTGKLSGSVHLAPANDPRAVGPMSVTANLSPTALRYKTLDIGTIDLGSYLGGGRFVLDHATIDTAGGVIHLWARSTSHVDNVRSSQLQVEFDRLDLRTLNQVFNPDSKPLAGKLAGNIVIIGSLQDRDSLFGQGLVNITNGDLYNLGGVKELKDQMHVEQNGQQTGAGTMKVRLDHDIITLSNASYFQSPVQVRALGQISDIWHLPDSPIDATLVGSLRPLKDVKLPMFSDADKILNALQQYATTIKVGGTVRTYHTELSTLKEAGDTMRALVLGEVEKK